MRARTIGFGSLLAALVSGCFDDPPSSGSSESNLELELGEECVLQQDCARGSCSQYTNACTASCDGAMPTPSPDPCESGRDDFQPLCMLVDSPSNAWECGAGCLPEDEGDPCDSVGMPGAFCTGILQDLPGDDELYVYACVYRNE